MPKRPLIRLCTATAVAGILASPGTAAGQVVLDPLKPCYVSVAPDRTEDVTVRGAGFTPYGRAEVRVNGAVAGDARADATGRLAVEVPAPYRARGERPFKVTVTDRTNPGLWGRLDSRVSALRVRIRPAAAKPGRKVRWVGRGFTAPGPLYAHYVKDGRERQTVRLAWPQGSCGRFAVKRRQFPFRPSVGEWTVQVDQQLAFAQAPASPFVKLPIVVRRVDG